MLEFQAPTHRVGACEFVSLAIGRDVSAALKKKYFLFFFCGTHIPAYGKGYKFTSPNPVGGA